MKSSYKNSNKKLILAAHPDDEVIGCAVLISRSLAKNHEINLAFFTNGVATEDLVTPDIIDTYGTYQNYIKVRKNEQKDAQKILGYTSILDLPLSSRTLHKNMDLIYRELVQVTISKNIDILFCPAYEGAHPDHDILNFLTYYICKTHDIIAYEYSGYHYLNSEKRYQQFIPKDTNEVWLNVSSNESSIKREAIEAYKSQGDMILKNFSHLREGFRELPTYDYLSPPTNEPTYYELWGSNVSSLDVCKQIDTFIRRKECDSSR